MHSFSFFCTCFRSVFRSIVFDKVNRLLWGIVKDEGCERTLRKYKKQDVVTMGKALKEAKKILINY